MLERSKLLFDRSNLIFDWSKISQWVFKKVFLSRVHHIVHTFLKAFWLLFLNQSNLSKVCHFLPKFFWRFCRLVLVSQIIPPFFKHFSCIYTHFSLKILNMGFLILGLFLIIFDQWVFVHRCCKHVSHALIWLIWWFEINWNF